MSKEIIHRQTFSHKENENEKIDQSKSNLIRRFQFFFDSDYRRTDVANEQTDDAVLFYSYCTKKIKSSPKERFSPQLKISSSSSGLFRVVFALPVVEDFSSKSSTIRFERTDPEQDEPFFESRIDQSFFALFAVEPFLAPSASSSPKISSLFAGFVVFFTGRRERKSSSSSSKADRNDFPVGFVALLV